MKKMMTHLDISLLQQQLLNPLDVSLLACTIHPINPRGVKASTHDDPPVFYKPELTVGIRVRTTTTHAVTHACHHSSPHPRHPAGVRDGIS
jgi:hypothetical protein